MWRCCARSSRCAPASISTRAAIAHAALELEQAYTAALLELPAEERPDLQGRIAELEQLRPGVTATARATFGESDPSASAASDTQALHHALARLEAALRARTAAGLGQGICNNPRP